MDAAPSVPVELWTRISSAFQSTSSAYDAKWQSRKRCLDSLSLVLLITKIVLSKTHQGYGTTIQNSWDDLQDWIPRLRAVRPVAASSFSEARAKLDEKIFLDLNAEAISIYEKEQGELDLWRGHRVFAVDGSRINLPKELREAGYTPPSNTSFYPQGKLSCLFNLKSKIPYDFELSTHCDERKSAISHLKKLGKKDVVVYDRGYLSYALLNAHYEEGVNAVFRLKPTQTFLAIQSFAKSNETERIVEVSLTGRPTRKAQKQFPGMAIRALPLRLIKYFVAGKTFILGTTLIDTKKYPAAEFADLYHSRWGIEELFKVSKRIIEVEQFHGRSERGVKQELYAHFFFITLSRIIANQTNDLMTRRTFSGPKKNLPSLCDKFQKLYQPG